MKFTSQTLQSRNTRLRFAVCLAVFLCHGICALQLSMVASRAPFSRSFDGSPVQSQKSFSNSVQSSSPSNGITSNLISNLAVMALKLRLDDQAHVGCDVTASSSEVLLKGQVGPVTVKGRGWQSRLGLTCRVIEATVDKCNLDMGRIISNQKLVLNTPAEGNAMVALNAFDFGNFITHPLMKPPGLPQVEGMVNSSSNLKFLKEGVTVDPSIGAVTFYGSYLGEKWLFTLRRGGNGQQAYITVEPGHSSVENSQIDRDSVAAGLAEVTSTFFNKMVFELDGTFLSFRDMMVTGKGKEPSVMMSLSILVRKFPSPGLEF